MRWFSLTFIVKPFFTCIFSGCSFAYKFGHVDDAVYGELGFPMFLAVALRRRLVMSMDVLPFGG